MFRKVSNFKIKMLLLQKDCLLAYEMLEEMQWTLDRLDNSIVIIKIMLLSVV